MIVLRPLPFGQTLFTFTAQVDVSEASKDFADADLFTDLFCKLANMFYDRFQKEDVIDAWRKRDFAENEVPSAPPLTDSEHKMLVTSMGLVEVLEAERRRLAGIAKDTVEKFLYQDREKGPGGLPWQKWMLPP